MLSSPIRDLRGTKSYHGRKGRASLRSVHWPSKKFIKKELDLWIEPLRRVDVPKIVPALPHR